MALNLIKKDKSHSVVSIKLDEQEFHNIFKEYYAALCSFAFQYMFGWAISMKMVPR